MFIELKVGNTNWFVFSGYNPYKRNISTFLKDIEKSLNKYLSKYGNIILLGDFNAEKSENAMIINSMTNYIKNMLEEAKVQK